MKQVGILLAVLVMAGTAQAQNWVDHTITDGLTNPNLTEAADIDGDGDLDVCTYARSSGIVYWFEQTVNDDWVQHVVDGDYDGCLQLVARDIDLDGDPDLIGTSDYPLLMVNWWENVNGDGSEWTRHVITEGAVTDELDEDNGRFADAGDFDGDGDLDVLISKFFWEHEIFWMENVDGSAQNWSLHMIEEEASLPGSPAIVDLDNDGDLDFTLINEGRLVAYYNTNGDGSSWTEVWVDQTQQFALTSAPAVADMNGDNRPDIVCGYAYTPTFFWYEATELFDIWIPHTVVDDLEYHKLARVGDLNGDGVPDISVTHLSGGDLRVYYSDGGLIPQWTEELVADSVGFTREHKLYDIDGDGDLDILLAQESNDVVTWFENLNQAPTVWLEAARVGDDEIPASGGEITYHVTLTSLLDVAVPGVQFWTDVVLPNGQGYGPLLQIPFTLMPHSTLNLNGLTQAVPAFAPQGDYAFLVHAGFMDGPQVMDAFPFSKSPVTAMGSTVQDWAVGGDLSALNGSTEVTIPEQFTVSEAWPNPFNSDVSVTISLPTAAEVRVTVYNTLGQQVAVISDGHHSAGTHQLSLHANNLASGVYLLHVKAVTIGSEVRKVVYVR